jgi:site-specific recombinase XerD
VRRAWALAGCDRDPGRTHALVLRIAAIAGSILGDVTIGQIDTYLDGEARRGGSRSSLHALGSSLRSFFRYGAQQGWCNSSTALGIDLPGLYALGDVPKAPTIDEVNKVLEASSAGNDSVTIRDHAILSLLIHYGLRRGEFERLTLDDIDWSTETLHVTRPKLRRPQCYPLWPAVGESIMRYLRQARPRCAHRAVFLTIKAPYRPLSGASTMVAMRLAQQGVKLNRVGAHCLRYSCAAQLMDAGFTLKQIADHLGHRSMNSTRIYTKIDIQGLRCAPAAGGGAGPGSVAMSITSTIAAYIQHNRHLGKRFITEERILRAFSRSVGKASLHGLQPAIIKQFVNRDGDDRQEAPCAGGLLSLRSHAGPVEGITHAELRAKARCVALHSLYLLRG